MITLVAEGPNVITMNTLNKQLIADYLAAQFNGKLIESANFPLDLNQAKTLVYVAEEGQTDELMLSFEQMPWHILSSLFLSEHHDLIKGVKAVPKTIFMNGLGNIAPVLEKIQKELGGQKAPFKTLKEADPENGVIVAFLENNDEEHLGTIYPESLYIPKDYSELYRYLSIHAPRYLSKAFPVDAWHMVDIRIYDKYEAYDLQYQRMVKAILALKLGYIVTEAWEREVSTFAPPMGTYRIRLLTFFTPVELKKILIGLEHGENDTRIVDLDLYWHKKKISWQEVLEDPETKKQLADKSFLPKSIFFAVKSDKNNLSTYCLEELRFKLTPEQKEMFAALDKEILGTNAK